MNGEGFAYFRWHCIIGCDGKNTTDICHEAWRYHQRKYTADKATGGP